MESFVILNNNELEDVNGGSGLGLLIGGVLLVGGALVGDYFLNKYTGRNAVQWVGVGLSEAGNALQKAGQALMN